MSELLIGFVLGLLVGWNLFPQPEFVKTGWGWGWGNLKKVLNKDEPPKTDDTSNTA